MIIRLRILLSGQTVQFCMALMARFYFIGIWRFIIR